MARILELYTCPEKLHGSTGRRKKLKLLSKNVLKKAWKPTRWLLEALSIIRDHKLEPSNIIRLSHEDLMKFRNRQIRAVSGSVIGVVVNSVISGGCPLFIFPACLNAWQTFVSGSNLHRVRREIERRATWTDFRRVKSEFLRRKRNHMAVAIATGATIKVVFVAAALSLIGLDNVIDSCSEAFGSSVNGSHAAGAATAAGTAHPPPHFSPHAPDSPSGGDTGAKPIDGLLDVDFDSDYVENTLSRADQLAADHPKIIRNRRTPDRRSYAGS